MLSITPSNGFVSLLQSVQNSSSLSLTFRIGLLQYVALNVTPTINVTESLSVLAPATQMALFIAMVVVIPLLVVGAVVLIAYLSKKKHGQLDGHAMTAHKANEDDFFDENWHEESVRKLSNGTFGAAHQETEQAEDKNTIVQLNTQILTQMDK